MLDKINFLDIVVDHIGTLKRYGAARPSVGDLILFFGVPAIPTVILPWQRIYLSNASVSVLITALAVFGALLFNLLILIYDVSGRPVNEDPIHGPIRQALLKEIHANVAISVLLTLVGILLLRPAALIQSDSVLHMSSYAAYYIGLVFVLTQLMVLRRVHLLLRRDIASQPTGRQP